MNLLIPALAISGSIVFGSPIQDEVSYQQEATEILDAGYIYGYADYPVFAAHDYMAFNGLWNIKKNALVIIDNTRYRVSHTALVDPSDTEILLHKTLFTCRNNNRKRFVVFLK